MLKAFTLKAQDTDNFGSFETDGYHSFCYNIQYLNDSYYFLMYEYDESIDNDRISLVETNTGLEVLNISSAIIPEEDLAIMAVDEEKNSFLCISRRQKRNDILLMFYQLSLDDLSITYTDSIRFTDTKKIGYFVNEKVDDTTFLIIGYDNKINGDKLNFYFEYSISGRVERVEELPRFPNNTITTSTYIDELEVYLMTTNFDDFIVMDKDFEIVNVISGKINYLNEQGDKVEGLSSCSFCRVSLDYIDCFAKMISTGDFGVSRIKLPITESGIGKVNEVYPLLEHDEGWTDRIQMLFVREDNQDNIIFVGSGDINPWNHQVDTNKIYISKLSPEFEKEWYIEFDEPYEFLVRSTEIVENDNILIAGEYTTDKSPDRSRNFYLKVKADGTISATKGPVPPDLMVVYPNPTSGPVNVKAESGDYAEYLVYDMQGQLLKRGEARGKNDFDIGELQAGTYFIHFKDRQGQVIGNSKVVKY